MQDGARAPSAPPQLRPLAHKEVLNIINKKFIFSILGEQIASCSSQQLFSEGMVYFIKTRKKLQNNMPFKNIYLFRLHKRMLTAL